MQIPEIRKMFLVASIILVYKKYIQFKRAFIKWNERCQSIMQYW
jgi:hypothetical protein